MKTILLRLAFLSCLAFFTMGQSGGGGCGGVGSGNGGIAGTGLHGGLDAGTTLDPNNPNDVKVTVGGHINFARRPLTPTEKKEIHDIAYRAGIDYMKSGAAQSAEPQLKANLVRRLAYKYRVHVSVLKPLAENGFEQGAHDSGEGFVPPQTKAENPDRIFRENAIKSLHL